MKMKIIKLGVLLVLSISAFSGCAKDDKKIEYQKVQTESKEKQDEETKMTNDNFEQQKEELYKKISEGTAYVKDFPNLLDKYDGENFSEGVAWVKFYKIPHYLCVDKAGKIVFALKDGEVPICSFNNGIAVINDIDKSPDEGTRIINKKGIVISAASEATYNRIIFDYNKFDSSNELYDGIVFVEKDIKTFDVNETRIGIINNEGKWLLEPTNKIKEVKYIDNDTFYIGSYYFSEEGNKEAYFYAKTKEILDKSSLDKMKNKNELIYQNDGFYDELNSKAIDLSRYIKNNKKIVNEPVFVDGYCALEIYDYHTTWYVIIDKTGKEMFEPRKIENYQEHIGKIKEGLLKILPHSGGDFTFIDMKGNAVIPKIRAEEVTDFSDGIAFVKNKYVGEGQDTNGESYYIDKEVKKLF